MTQEVSETVIVPIPPDLFESKGEERRNSSGKASIYKKRIPNYLKPSTGSCHDFCKYGRNHTFQVKERRPFRRRLFVSNEVLDDKRHEEKIPTSGNRKKKVIQKEKAEELMNSMENTVLSPPNGISSADEMSDLIVEKSIVTDELIVSSNRTEEFIEEPTIIELEIPPGLASSNASSENSPANDDREFPGEVIFMEKCIVESENGILKKSQEEYVEPESIKPNKLASIKKAMASSKEKVPGSKQIKARTSNASDLRREVARSKSNESVNNKGIKQKETDESVKSTSIIKQKTSSKIKQDSTLSGVRRTLKPITSSTSKKTDTSNRTQLKLRTPPISKSTNTLSKSTSSGLARILKPITSSPSKKTDTSNRTQLKLRTPQISKSVNTLSKTGSKRVLRSLSGEKRVLRSLSLTSIPSVKLRNITKNSRLGSTMKTGKKESENNEQYTQTRKLRSLSTLSNHSPQKKKDKEGMLIKTVIGPRKKTELKPVQRRNVNAKMQEATPHKLSFRQGKVVVPQAENTAPKRLRFRPRAAGEHQNGIVSSQRRILMRKRSELGRVGESNGRIGEASRVVLRHQEQQEKKDKQGLFNHVIEETASKLVETRKSKVKALVGAFETVISLQENKKDYA
ncbi:uncharacterized protein LOC120267670 [Dioscorea cayenensis subsp. rotundata]|uniref:Uncharacterized protein LOC120267670 n=1 Tax=Dioscorea cayennensis subsp. rotundata TaxID=55577 RepID=A0AB40BWG7_DIOCR|nr:uncharacterized protein LOC120267670 [Dioscorea cayenensis subsp. rotundata]XP_039131278.1 uncharacterized protein LOC120267670 [Dioscorea cayenensis subsp. rotundata]